MKRDNEYLRELLFEIENNDDYLVIAVNTYGKSAEESKRYYHIQLLCDAEYMVQINESTYRLTSQGHDFIEAIRDNGIWDKTKDAVANTGGNATIEMVKTLAVGFLKKTISEHTGIEL